MPIDFSFESSQERAAKMIQAELVTLIKSGWTPEMAAMYFFGAESCYRVNHVKDPKAEEIASNAVKPVVSD